MLFSISSMRSPMLTRNLLCLTVTAASLIGGCSKERPYHIVKRDGEVALRGSDYAAAELSFAEMVRRRPEDHQARYLLAKAYVEGGQPRTAVEELTIALDISPLKDEYLDLQARAMLESNERDALTTLLRRNASERGRVSDYLRLGEYSRKLGNADEAREALLIAAKLDQGKTAKPQIALADFYASVADVKSQTRRLRMAYFIDPRNPEAVAGLTALGETPAPGFGLVPDESPIKTGIGR
jgi:cytochrome c-type biogenesis protein CcmH/NrfG